MKEEAELKDMKAQMRISQLLNEISELKTKVSVFFTYP